MNGVTSYGFTIQELRAQQFRCAYPSKMCSNPRAVKLCGSLHKLCEFHRKKANLNQKRLQQRRRVIRAQMAVQREHQQQGDQHERLYNDPSMTDSSLALLFSYSDSLKTEPCRTEDSSIGCYDEEGLSDQDAQLLQSILFGEPQFAVFGSGNGEENDESNNSKNTYDQQSFGAMEIYL